MTEINKLVIDSSSNLGKLKSLLNLSAVIIISSREFQPPEQFPFAEHIPYQSRSKCDRKNGKRKRNPERWR